MIIQIFIILKKRYNLLIFNTYVKMNNIIQKLKFYLNFDLS